MKTTIALLFGVLMLSLSASAQRGRTVRAQCQGGGYYNTTTVHHGPRHRAPVYRAPACGPRYVAPRPVYRTRAVRNCGPVYQTRVWVPRVRVWDGGCGAYVWQPGYWSYY